MVWHRGKTIFAKSIASVLLSNVSPEKAGDKYEDMLMDMYPSMRADKIAKKESTDRYLRASRGKRIYIRNILDA